MNFIVKLVRGYVYLVCILDWFSRYVLSWELSNSQDVFFCLSALEKALRKGKPRIFNLAVRWVELLLREEDND